METQTQTVVHIICGRCYNTKPNLREPLVLLMPHCQRLVCCYCHNPVAYEGLFYRDEPRLAFGGPCDCGSMPAILEARAKEYGESMKRYRERGWQPDSYVLLNDHRGRGAHLYPAPKMTAKQLEAFVQQNGRSLYTGFPSPEQKP